MSALKNVALMARNEGGRMMYAVTAFYVDGTECVLFESRSCIEAMMWRPGRAES